MTDSEAKAHIIVPLSRKVGIRATTHIAQSWRSVVAATLTEVLLDILSKLIAVPPAVQAEAAHAPSPCSTPPVTVSPVVLPARS